VDARERQQRQTMFLRAWLRSGRVAVGLERAGIRWQHAQSWRRWDPDFRRRSDLVRDALRATQ
jgi:hypothetical protein